MGYYSLQTGFICGGNMIDTKDGEGGNIPTVL